MAGTAGVGRCETVLVLFDRRAGRSVRAPACDDPGNAKDRRGDERKNGETAAQTESVTAGNQQ